MSHITKACLTATFVVCAPIFVLAQNITAITLSGQAVNVSVGITAGVIIEISDTGNNELVARGAFDNKNLFGSFRASGRYLEECAPTHLCLHFDGVLENLVDGGFSADTATSFSMALTLPRNAPSAIGAYRTGLLPSFSQDQYGTLTLTAAPLALKN
jgi:hypothetical protein